MNLTSGFVSSSTRAFVPVTLGSSTQIQILYRRLRTCRPTWTRDQETIIGCSRDLALSAKFSVAGRQHPALEWRRGDLAFRRGSGKLRRCCGIADPLTAEGIGPALETGIWAGNCARNYVNGDGRSDLEQYSERIRQRFTTRYSQKHERSLLKLLSGTRNTGSIGQQATGAGPTMN